MDRSQAGFTLWELIVVVSLVVILFAVALENLLPLRGAAERAQVLHTVGSLRSALGLQATERVVTEGREGLVKLAEENPLEWLAITPAVADANMIGEIPRGHWSWLPQSSILAYRLSYPEYVDGAFQGEWLRFTVTLARSDEGDPRGLALRALDSARWKLPDDMIEKALSRESSREEDDDGHSD